MSPLERPWRGFLAIKKYNNTLLNNLKEAVPLTNGMTLLTM